MLIALITLAVVCLIQFYFVIRFARMLFQFEDRIEIALDKINESYSVIGEILERPLFFDSPEIREVHRQVGIVNTYLLSIANDLADVELNPEEE
tara:strand:- start:1474 stop:1755 length:282 start_codon:yes stop_codon:yes gene_type:complete